MAVSVNADLTTETQHEADPPAVADSLAGAEFGEALHGCRQYLLMVANAVLGPKLQAKLGASDLVQETFVEAQRHAATFRGTNKAALRAWLREILECLLSNVRRAYLATGKRAIGREVATEALLVDVKCGPRRMRGNSQHPAAGKRLKPWCSHGIQRRTDLSRWKRSRILVIVI